MLECRRIGNPPPGVPPGELAHDGAIRIFGVIRVLSDRRLLVNVLATRRKLLSLAGDEVNQPPNIAEAENAIRLRRGKKHTQKYRPSKNRPFAASSLPPSKNQQPSQRRGAPGRRKGGGEGKENQNASRIIGPESRKGC